jgi:phage shock protein A
MSILSRLQTLVRANASDLVGGRQDPTSEVRVVIAEAERELRQARVEAQSALAERRRLERQRDRLCAEAGTWEERARQALRAGDEELARQALGRKLELERQAAELAAAAEEQRRGGQQLLTALTEAEAQVRALRARQGTLEAEARAAAAGSPLEGGAGGGVGGALSEFDRIGHGVDAAAAEAELAEELGGRSAASARLERRFDELARERGVEDSLAELKKKLEP